MSQPLLLLVGGRSTEHDASLHGYQELVRHLQVAPHRFALHGVVYLPRDGGFRIFEAPPWPRMEAELAAGPAASPAQALELLRDSGCFVFSLLHGNEGEDGGWQGVAEVFDIPGNFGPVLPAALGMDKRLQGMVVSALVPELRIPRTWLVRVGSGSDHRERVLREAGAGPIVVKPNCMGASLLTSHLWQADPGELGQALEDIFPYDPEALVQEYIDGPELTCGVLRQEGNTIALPVLEAVTANGFLGHREKHRPGQVEVVVRAHDDPQARTVMAHSVRLFDELNLFGFARFDFRCRAADIFFLEVNTLPGIMRGSAFPLMLEAGGRCLMDVVQACVEGFISRPARSKKLPYEIGH
jgi:D-alanine-D-alanine ligase